MSSDSSDLNCRRCGHPVLLGVCNSCGFVDWGMVTGVVFLLGVGMALWCGMVAWGLTSFKGSRIEWLFWILGGMVAILGVLSLVTLASAVFISLGRRRQRPDASPSMGDGHGASRDAQRAGEERRQEHIELGVSVRLEEAPDNRPEKDSIADQISPRTEPGKSAPTKSHDLVSNLLESAEILERAVAIMESAATPNEIRAACEAIAGMLPQDSSMEALTAQLRESWDDSSIHQLQQAVISGLSKQAQLARHSAHEIQSEVLSPSERRDTNNTTNDGTNSELTVFYDKVGVTNVEHCAHCNILLPNAATLPLINCAGLQQHLFETFMNTVARALGEENFQMSSESMHSLSELGDFVSQFTLRECSKCNKHICPACLSRTKGVCLACELPK